MVISFWNAPETAITLPGEFFNERSVDDGASFGFHRMNAFTGLERIPGTHFHDIEKNADVDKELGQYLLHLDQSF